MTGSHAIKAGIQYGNGYFFRQRREAADLIQLYRSGAPAQVIIHNTPQDSLQMMNQDQGIYVQDSWTLGRFTINPGVRFEHFNGSIGERGVAPPGGSCRRGISTPRPTCRTGTTWRRDSASRGTSRATARPR